MQFLTQGISKNHVSTGASKGIGIHIRGGRDLNNLAVLRTNFKVDIMTEMLFKRGYHGLPQYSRISSCIYISLAHSDWHIRALTCAFTAYDG
eukprot:scaffold253047_cov83-Attheya_sp.AAC.2